MVRSAWDMFCTLGPEPLARPTSLLDGLPLHSHYPPVQSQGVDSSPGGASGCPAACAPPIGLRRR
eukprot:4562436-Pyramimonas_sp.AAC.1